MTASTPIVTDQTLSRYQVSGTTLKAFISISGTSYVMTSGNKTPIVQYADAYSASSLGAASLPSDYFNTAAQASYLVKSSASSNSQLWLITGGQKIALTFEQAVTYGYLSRSIQPTVLSPAWARWSPLEH